MKYRVAGVVLVAALLGGCTDADWDRTLSYVGLDDAPAAQPAPADSSAVLAAKPAALAEADEWCNEVAKAEQQEAAEQGFDKATQENRSKVAFQQCAAKR
jgi:hypothetical protein